MRPNSLNPLFASITALPGVGPKGEKLYARLLGRDSAARVLDLLFHLPTGSIDRRAGPTLREVVPGTVVTVAVTVERHRAPPPGRSRAPYLIYAGDGTGDSSSLISMRARSTWRSFCRSGRGARSATLAARSPASSAATTSHGGSAASAVPGSA